MTPIIGQIDPEIKSRLDRISEQIYYFMYEYEKPGRMSWLLTCILKYQAVLDEMV